MKHFVSTCVFLGALMCFGGSQTQAISLISFDILTPQEGDTVTPGETLTVTVYAYNSVAGIQYIQCQGEGDSLYEYDYPMSPPTISTTEYFDYHVPVAVTDGEQLTITVKVMDYVDGLFTKTVNVYVSGGATPTPTATPTPVPQTYPSIDIDSSVKAAVVDGKRDRLYLTNNANDRVDIVDLGTRQITGSVAVGSSPWGAGLTSDTSRLYVANRVDNTVSVVDLDSDTVVDTIDLTPAVSYSGDLPRGLAVGTHFAWVGADGIVGEVLRIDLDTGNPTRQLNFGLGATLLPAYVVASQDGSRVFAAEYGVTPPTVVLFDGDTGSALTDTRMLSVFCDGLALSPDGSRIAFVNLSGTTTILDPSLDYAGSVNIAHAPAFMPTNWNVLAGFTGSYPNEYQTLHFQDLKAGATAKDLPGIETQSGTERYDSVADPNGGWLYVYGEGKLYFIDTGYLLPVPPSVWTQYE